MEKKSIGHVFEMERLSIKEGGGEMHAKGWQKKGGGKKKRVIDNKCSLRAGKPLETIRTPISGYQHDQERRKTRQRTLGIALLPTERKWATKAGQRSHKAMNLATNKTLQKKGGPQKGLLSKSNHKASKKLDTRRMGGKEH